MRRAKAGLAPAPALENAVNTDKDLSQSGFEESEYGDLYHFAPVAYARLDRHGVVVEINQAGCLLLQRTVNTIVGHPLVALIAQETRSDFLEHMRRVRNTEEVVETDLVLDTRDGLVPVRAYTKRTSTADRVMCWMMLMDLTERLRLEAARREADEQRQRAVRDEQLARTTSEAKDRFLAMLSHELRTPLTPALLAVNQLLIHSADEVVTELSQVILRNIEIEAHLINDLLDVTRIGRGRLEIELEPADLHSIILEAIDVCRSQAELKQVRLMIDLGARAHYVLADRTRLRQVFWNLLMNAIKFSERGRVAVKTDDDPSGGIRISIWDSGLGMTPETLARLFRPFERDARRIGGSGPGLGLGLTICKGIIDAHMGRIWAMSPGPGQGSTFEIELMTVEAPQAATVARALIESTANSGSRVLLVEDDDDTASMLKILLKNDGHQVGVAHTLKEAIRESEGTWDIVLSDLGLPDGSGLEVARRMRSLSPRPRLIALSGFGSPQDIARSHDAGFDEHLVKPLDFDTLRKLLMSA